MVEKKEKKKVVNRGVGEYNAKQKQKDTPDMPGIWWFKKYEERNTSGLWNLINVFEHTIEGSKELCFRNREKKVIPCSRLKGTWRYVI